METTNNIEKGTMSKLINDINFRTETLNKLSIKNKIELSSRIERYQYLLKERLLIQGKLYGSRKYQEIDATLQNSMKVIGEKVESILNLY